MWYLSCVRIIYVNHQKKNESYFRTSHRIYRLAQPLHVSEMLSLLSKSRILYLMYPCSICLNDGTIMVAQIPSLNIVF